MPAYPTVGPCPVTRFGNHAVLTRYARAYRWVGGKRATRRFHKRAANRAYRRAWSVQLAMGAVDAPSEFQPPALLTACQIA